jgi:hypothetical protein
MAFNVTIGGNGTLFIGEDKRLRIACVDNTGLPTDMTGWVLDFDVRTSDTAPSSVLTLTPTLVGTFDTNPSLNTQRAIVTLTAANMNLFRPKLYRYSVKRIDPGEETVLLWGSFLPQRATAP